MFEDDLSPLLIRTEPLLVAGFINVSGNLFHTLTINYEMENCCQSKTL